MSNGPGITLFEASGSYKMEAHVEYFINWIMLGTSGMISLVIIFDRIFDRRHKLFLLMIYLCLKIILVAYYETVFNYMDSTRQDVLIWTLCTLFTTVANFVVIYYTWRGSALKIALVGVLSDVFTASTMLASMALVNIVMGKDMAFSYLGLSIYEGAIISILSILLILLLLLLIKPAIRWFQNHELRHRRLALFLVIAIIAFFTVSKVSVSEKTDISLVIGYSLIVTLAVPMVLYMMRRTGQSQRRRDILKQRQEMISAYALAMEEQAAVLEESRRFLSDVEGEIDRMKNALDKTRFDKYLSQLKEQAETMGRGHYSSDVYLDAILLAFVRRLKEKGVTANFKVTPLQGSEEAAANVSMLLLQWVLKEIESIKTHEKGSLKFSISLEAGQLVYLMETTGTVKASFPKGLLSDELEKEDVIADSRKGKSYQLTIIQGVER